VDTPLIIDFKIINSHLQDFKLYALQRQDKSFSQQLWKMVNDLEKLVFKRPKTLHSNKIR
jgi:ATP-dependent helicase/DNAse subunit B